MSLVYHKSPFGNVLLLDHENVEYKDTMNKYLPFLFDGIRKINEEAKKIFSLLNDVRREIASLKANLPIFEDVKDKEIKEQIMVTKKHLHHLIDVEIELSEMYDNYMYNFCVNFKDNEQLIGMTNEGNELIAKLQSKK